MSKTDLQSTPFFGGNVSKVRDGQTAGIDHGMASEFGKVMDGLAASSGKDNGPSIFSRFVDLPVDAYRQAMSAINVRPPDDMPVLDAMEFYNRQKIVLNESRVVQSVATTVVKMVKRDIETVMNNK